MADTCRIPSGVITFLFTDVEGSTRLWAADRESMSASLVVHDGIIRTSIESRGGYVFTTAGDSFSAAFERAADAVAAAQLAQRELSTVAWPGPPLKVRMGLHLGEAELRGGDYFGPVVNTTARVEAAGHGGQILLTDAVQVAAAIAATDLGVHRLRDVPEPLRLFQVGDGDFPPLRVVDAGRSNLPSRPHRLLGRADDVQRVRQLLRDHRLVTVTAAGGSGKTRLAIAVGEAELSHRPGGVWFVDLTAVTSGADVPAAVAGAVGLTLTGGDATDQVVSYLADKTTLVILDNCEHLVDACADFVVRVLAVHGASAFLATSREALDVDGERVVALGTLRSDAPDAPGVQLFIDRATAVYPDIPLTDDTLGTIAAVCTRLDGLPLAIELAAARSTVLGPAALLAGLDDRFALLSGGGRRRRRRTLEATLDWSYDLLDPEEQRAFRALGVFVDGFDLEAVATVASVTRVGATDVVEALVAKSLVVRADLGGTLRFRLLESMKAYAEQRLGEAGELERVRRLHFEHFHRIASVHGLAPQAELRLGFRLRHDMSNVTSAFELATDGGNWDGATELLSGALGAYEYFGRTLEGLALVERAIEHWSDVDPVRVDHLLALSLSSLGAVDDYASAQARSMRLAESTVAYLRVIGLVYHGWAVSYSGPERAARLIASAETALEEARRSEPGRNTEIAAMYFFGYRAGHRLVELDYRGALDDAREVTAMEARLGFRSSLGAVAITAMSLVLLGEPARALDLLGRQEGTFLAAVHVPMIDFIGVLARLELGQLEAADQVRAIALRGMARRYAHEANDCVVLLAGLALAEGNREIAAELVLDAGTGSGPSCIMADYFAGRLHLGSVRRQRIVDAIRSRDPVNNTGRAAIALQRELARRGWAIE